MKTSRRNFLRTAAAGAGSAALAGIGAAGCSSTEFGQVKNWDHEAEIVVLGLGAAGLMTAITARDRGADVLILEKAPEEHAGGNTRVSGQGYWCPENTDNAVEYQNAMSDGFPIPDEVTEAFHTRSVHVTEWLTELGADMRTIPSQGEYPDFPG
ncbi:MAG: FAD-binding protein, partial [Acidobacteria bacterium]|nr:FAD-binding protein [Acidobacteriota bacterium]